MGDLDGKWCVVTGGSAGIGLEISRELSKRGASLVVVGSNETRGAEAIAELKKTARAELRFARADLSSIADTRRLGQELAQLPRLDVLVNNAAIIPAHRVLREGVESALAANTVAPWLLTRALLPLLTRSAPARVVLMVGDLVPIELDDPSLARGEFNGWHAYRRSKFATMLMMTALSRELAGSGVTVNAAFPGIVDTPGMDSAIAAMPGSQRWVIKLIRPFMRTPVKGAQSAIYVSTDPTLSAVTGKMFSIGKPFVPRAKGWDDPSTAQRMIEVLESLTAAA